VPKTESYGRFADFQLGGRQPAIGSNDLHDGHDRGGPMPFEDTSAMAAARGCVVRSCALTAATRELCWSL
jgi:hypothetical protein